ncbi:MAG: DUF1614 domain-containing protein [Humidesulfovibrio sp.]|nr:DUF1614 domain-containing protein [Humidesulfovibrio sp.]
MFFQARPPIFLLSLVAIVLLGLFIIVPVSLVASAFGKLGLTGPQGLAVFLLTVVGSRWNIPIWRTTRLVRGEAAPASRIFSFGGGFSGQLGRVRFGQNPFGPAQDPGLLLSEQVLAVNVGGCLVPCALSAWFLWQMQLSGVLGGWMILCVLIPALACYLLARPMPGIGIAVPVLLPPAVAAITALLVVPVLAGHDSLAPRAAYMAGTLGTLIGADLGHMLNRRTLALLDAPLLSIGGAGTFDGIFLAGIIAVLLA